MRRRERGAAAAAAPGIHLVALAWASPLASRAPERESLLKYFLPYVHPCLASPCTLALGSAAQGPHRSAASARDGLGRPRRHAAQRAAISALLACVLCACICFLLLLCGQHHRRVRVRVQAAPPARRRLLAACGFCDLAYSCLCSCARNASARRRRAPPLPSPSRPCPKLPYKRPTFIQQPPSSNLPVARSPCVPALYALAWPRSYSDSSATGRIHIRIQSPSPSRSRRLHLQRVLLSFGGFPR